MIDGTWLSVRRDDPRAFAFYRRHYSSGKQMKAFRERGNTNFMGPGECMVLLAKCGRGVFAWQFNTVERYDKQTGVCCTIFRNEGAGLSSELIREADDLARARWPEQLRHFTYVDAGKIRAKRDPGRCFLRAGWRRAGQSKQGLVLLERVW
jgi:hypothetical protein